MPSKSIYIANDATVTMLLDYMVVEKIDNLTLDRVLADQIIREYTTPESPNVPFRQFGRRGVFHFIYRDTLFILVLDRNRKGPFFEVERFGTVDELTMKFYPDPKRPYREDGICKQTGKGCIRTGCEGCRFSTIGKEPKGE